MRLSRLRVPYLLICLAALVGCQSVNPLMRLDTVIVDLSKSRLYQQEATENGLMAYASKWTDQAANGDILEVVFFSEANPYGYKQVCLYQMVLFPPAFKYREKTKKELTAKLKAAYDAAKWTENTPILEILSRLGENHGSSPNLSWHLVIISDLMQSSKKLTLSSQYLSRSSDAMVVEKMSSLSLAPKFPPETIDVYYFPGLVNKNTAIETLEYRKVLSIFRNFLGSWASAAQVKFTNLEEVQR